jgi:hypothetical protein
LAALPEKPNTKVTESLETNTNPARAAHHSWVPLTGTLTDILRRETRRIGREGERLEMR